MVVHGKTTDCLVHVMHVRIADVRTCAEEVLKSISDKSWVTKLDIINQTAYTARCESAIERLANGVIAKVEDKVTGEFGEYVVSHCGQRVLVEGLHHYAVPLAELWKEKVSGNPGFDFHTESQTQMIVFGEAKYSSSSNPYPDAMKQIECFISKKKDQKELSDLRNFVSENSALACVAGKKAYVAAFSINSGTPENIMQNALQCDYIDALLVYPELYLVGVQICA